MVIFFMAYMNIKVVNCSSLREARMHSKEECNTAVEAPLSKVTEKSSIRTVSRFKSVSSGNPFPRIILDFAI